MAYSLKIQEEIEKIHSQFGTTEAANHKIQKLFDTLLAESIESLSERLRTNTTSHEAVENYKLLMRRRYKSRVDSLREIFPNGMFTKDSSGELVGIDVMMARVVRELSELNCLD